MPTKQSPSRTEYVVVTLNDDERKAVARRIGADGSVEPIKGHSNLTLIRLRDLAVDPRQAWEQAHVAIGGRARIQPVLLDSEGKPQYPTGEISVRFRTGLSDADLQTFAKRHRLRLLRRNEFVPEQAVFEPVEKDRYLPDVVDELGATDDARLAWANTIAGFERS